MKFKSYNSTWIAACLSIFLATACESTDNVLNKIDHTVPSVLFSQDTLEVTAGEKITVQAVIADESGIQRMEFSYGDWRINQIIDLKDSTLTTSYPFSLEITVPVDAAKQWEESKYFNDGSSIKITQQYHQLILSAWDNNRNLRKGILYVKVR